MNISNQNQNNFNLSLYLSLDLSSQLPYQPPFHIPSNPLYPFPYSHPFGDERDSDFYFNGSPKKTKKQKSNRRKSAIDLEKYESKHPDKKSSKSRDKSKAKKSNVIIKNSLVYGSVDSFSTPQNRISSPGI
jgi:hypothetical protein